MKTSSLALASVLLASNAFAAVGHNSAGADKTSAVTNHPTVVEEEWFVPLRMESVDELDNARMYYRRDNERAAADEVRKAASWLSFAAESALPHTKDALESARTELLTLADDLDTGKLAGAARLDGALAQASNALAEWHYYRARDEFGRRDTDSASRDLEAAAAHLESAARSAHLQFGPDTITMFEDIYEDGKIITDGRTVDYDVLAERIDGIEHAVEKMADTLKRS
jgi:hypothetical protein